AFPRRDRGPDQGQAHGPHWRYGGGVNMQPRGHHVTARNNGYLPGGLLLAISGAFLLAGCCGAGNCARVGLIGKQTASGEVRVEGQTFNYVYRAVGVPMMETAGSDYSGKDLPRLMPAMEDEGVPLIEISATSGSLDEKDESRARNAAIAVCEQNRSWRLETMASHRRGHDHFNDFFDAGVWSFVMLCT
ncbi:MAG: hypothetical protein WBC95_09455, partial [Albidovulum sp.]